LVSSTDVSNLYTSIHDYQALNTCGASGTAACQVSIYEWGQNTLSISGSTIDQTHLDYANAGGGNAVIDALVPLSLIQTYGIDKTNMFSLAQYQFQSGSLQAKLWGEVVDMGGATNNVRPGYLGLELANAANIGNMYSCPISSGPTYTFAGSTSTPNPPSAMPSLSGVPYLYAFCFENGTARAQVYINTDLTSSHTLTFAGTNPPTGTVTVKQVAPPSLDSLNEAATGTPTNTTAATVSIATSSLTSPSSVSLPPYSVTEITYSTSAPAPPVLTGYAVGHSW